MALTNADEARWKRELWNKFPWNHRPWGSTYTPAVSMEHMGSVTKHLGYKTPHVTPYGKPEPEFGEERKPLLDGLGDFTATESEIGQVRGLVDEGLTVPQIAERTGMREIDVMLICLDAVTDRQGRIRWR